MRLSALRPEGPKINAKCREQVRFLVFDSTLMTSERTASRKDFASILPILLIACCLVNPLIAVFCLSNFKLFVLSLLYIFETVAFSDSNLLFQNCMSLMCYYCSSNRCYTHIMVGKQVSILIEDRPYGSDMNMDMI